MGVSDWMKPGISSKQRVKIITVDPASRRVEGALKDGALIQIAVWEIPALFIWPQEEEYWTVHQDNGYWMLGSRMDPPDGTTQVESLSPGDAKLASNKVVLPDGNKLVKSSVQAIGVGVNSVSFAASTTSSNVVISHTLGATPVHVGLTISQNTNNLVELQWFSASSTSFTVRGVASTSITATLNFSWAAYA